MDWFLPPLAAETLGVREAINLAINLQWTKVIIVSDCKELIRACGGDKELGDIHTIIADIRGIKQATPICSFTWTKHEGNGAAHLLAKLKYEKNLSPLWFSSPPPILFLALYKDLPQGHSR